MLKRFTQEHMVPIMRKNHFKKNGLTWRRQDGTITHIVELQASQWNDSESQAFTINYGTLLERLWLILWGGEPPSSIGGGDCFPRFRIGELTDTYTTDVWWTLNAKSNDKVSGEVQQLLETEVLRNLNGCNSIDKMLSLADREERWKQPADRISYAILSHLNRQHDSCEKILNEIIANDKLAAWGDRVKQVKERLKCAQFVPLQRDGPSPKRECRGPAR